MDNSVFENSVIVASFLLYFILHSLTASLRMKGWVARHWPASIPYYRLAFNGFAIVSALPLLLLLVYFPGQPLWQWQGVGLWVTNGLALASGVGFILSLKAYDMEEFWGTRQVRAGSHDVHDQERFQISDFHRFVRHPWYFFLLVLLWTRDLTTSQFTAYLMLTLYLVIGSRMEERKLLRYHGEVYRRYRQRVPGLFPLPWRYLTRQQAKQLAESAETRPLP